MNEPIEAPTVRSKDHTGNTTTNSARQAYINRSIGCSFLDLDKHIAWHGAFVLDQLIVRRAEDGWQAIVKAHRNGKPYVAFINADTYAEALEFTQEFADRGVLTWLTDKHPSKWFKLRK